MKRIVLAVLYWVSLATYADDARQNEIRYFTKIVGIISPFIDYTLVGEISEGEAKEQFHYRVTYDNLKRKSEISYFLKDKPASDSYFYTHSVRYEYQGTGVTRRYFDEYSEPAFMWRHYYLDTQIHKEQFDYVDNVIRLRFYDVDNQRIETGIGAYEMTKQMISEKKFVQRQYNSEGKATVLTHYFPTEINVIELDEMGYLLKIINVDSKSLQPKNHPSAGYAVVEFDFDIYGNEMGWWFEDVQGSLVSRPEHIEDPGYAIWRYSPDWKERRLGRWNNFSISYYDEQDKPVRNSANIGGSRYHFANNQLVKLEYLDVDGSLMSGPDGHAFFVLERDESGKRLSAQFYDANRALVKTGTAIRYYLYDDNGVQTGTRELDHNRKEITQN